MKAARKHYLARPRGSSRFPSVNEDLTGGEHAERPRRGALCQVLFVPSASVSSCHECMRQNRKSTRMRNGPKSRRPAGARAKTRGDPDAPPRRKKTGAVEG